MKSDKKTDVQQLFSGAESERSESERAGERESERELKQSKLKIYECIYSKHALNGVGLFFVSARTNKRHHHQAWGGERSRSSNAQDL